MSNRVSEGGKKEREIRSCIRLFQPLSSETKRQKENGGSGGGQLGLLRETGMMVCVHVCVGGS